MPEVVIYTRSFCSYCVWAKRLLDSKNIPYCEIVVDGDNDLEREMIERSDGRMTAPQILIRGQSIGGFDELSALDERGELDSLLSHPDQGAGEGAASPSPEIESVVILGSGAAGLTAAIYTARANLKPLLVEGRAAGGQLTLTTDVENFPGFPTGVMGPDLIGEMRKQADRFGTRFLGGDATAAALGTQPLTLTVDGSPVQTRTLIIATGADARLLGLDSEKKLIGHGLSTCATCDGFFFN